MRSIVRRLWDSALVLTYIIIGLWAVAAAIRFLPTSSIGEIFGSTLAFAALLFAAKATHHWGIWVVTGKNNET